LGYLGAVKSEDKAKLFHGDEVNVKAVLTFQGRNVKEIETAFGRQSTIVWTGAGSGVGNRNNPSPGGLDNGNPVVSTQFDSKDSLWADTAQCQRQLALLVLCQQDREFQSATQSARIT